MRKLEDEEIPEKENQEAGSPREGKKGKEKERDSEGSLLKEEKDSAHEEQDSPHEKEEKDSSHEEKEKEFPNYAAISVLRLLSLR
jgi:hypothetical protein